MTGSVGSSLDLCVVSGSGQLNGGVPHLGSAGSSLVALCVVSESGQSNGGVPHLSLIVGLGLVLHRASVEFTDISVGEPGLSLSVGVSSAVAAWDVGELQGLLVGGKRLLLRVPGLCPVSVTTAPVPGGPVAPGGARQGGMS